MKRIEEPNSDKQSRNRVNDKTNKVGSVGVYDKNHAYNRGRMIYPANNYQSGWINGSHNKPGIIAHEDIPL
ncbi:MAG: hypothetical protein ACXVDZ_12195 [Bacteroidia bacterium]